MHKLSIGNIRRGIGEPPCAIALRCLTYASGCANYISGASYLHQLCSVFISFVSFLAFFNFLRYSSFRPKVLLSSSSTLFDVHLHHYFLCQYLKYFLLNLHYLMYLLFHEILLFFPFYFTI